MKMGIFLATLLLCSCSNNGELVTPIPEGNMAAAATNGSSQPVNLRPSGTTTSVTPPMPPADTMNQAAGVQPVPQVPVQRVVVATPSSTTTPSVAAVIPPEMRNSSSIYLADNFDDVLLKTGRPDFIQYQGNRAFVSFKANDFTMYQGGECKVIFEKRLVQKCEGCNLQKFPCSE
jgi:ABC-type Fe3+-hydroxamate transport system substrate-binding protein